jgi:hypothetical protein
LHRHTVVLTFVVRESCYSVLQTLLHGAFQWLQPRSPVVAKVAKRGRGPDPPDARVEVESGRAALVRQPEGNHLAVNPRVAKAADGNRLRGNRAAAKEAHARAEAASVALLAAEGSLL